ncbi:MAG: UPF0262 family protein [Rhodospirillaceae bacterium]|jgi:uncharacterized protein (UPF0262 family)|nr:UPF0262 family protein [Rhodospirillaceae bacterium]MBT6205267.1 UPF0262 family protein [Rhodospirillaceae bacterium]MBT6512986.1 UPF0262 family protein [Rhodospirillaceae bacterium]MBT7614349.1 UPF0262 family protein [Rhodospirillaceae bacterium]MBT7645753.1 UPF0262 family protein [Rhodospirillaceae bacterium]
MTENSANLSKIVYIQLDDRLVVRRSPEIEHEMAVAIFDLLEDNLFEPVDAAPGPYRVKLAIRDGRSLVFEVCDDDEAPLVEVIVPLNLFRRIVKDYFTVCESYFDAIKTATASRIEALDMGRRGLHNEGAELLRDNLDGRITIDDETARRLFTLICVLHVRG